MDASKPTSFNDLSLLCYGIDDGNAAKKILMNYSG